MYCVRYVVKDWYDYMLGCRHDVTRDGAIFDTLDDIKKWAEEYLTNGYICEIEDIKTGNSVDLNGNILKTLEERFAWYYE